MSEYWNDIFGGTKSLLVGLGITAREFFKPVVTEQYPWEVPVMTPRFRGHIELVKNAETGKPNCVVCGMCMRSCPSGCITLAGKKPEGEKKKVLTQYELDFTKCSLCGSCIESCNFNAIQFSKDYNLASTRKEDYLFDLLKRLEEQS
ncbi:NADH-quinone oxidoreductase subunit I [bacterium BMS3Bbin14]|nr:NADH-quinone oxidoreductase subunit I [bacterium BMS3Abin13]GBE52069.1 NADH-quinone oxidoreductase subunit I [bacterium BMS3Bbin14]HDK43722.1 4Fe-4S dicluster domain-containing protein [Desulfobacteraceae bacterium]HDO30301.1 4Fe-4S dicluster domain-containing protein [Desulfobacteraceae bacterium]